MMYKMFDLDASLGLRAELWEWASGIHSLRPSGLRSIVYVYICNDDGELGAQRNTLLLELEDLGRRSSFFAPFLVQVLE
ncbi:hypothetical protein MPTK1_4g20350 [Marchantia polymorpha subsp. ruderalis]